MFDQYFRGVSLVFDNYNKLKPILMDTSFRASFENKMKRCLEILNPSETENTLTMTGITNTLTYLIAREEYLETY